MKSNMLLMAFLLVIPVLISSCKKSGGVNDATSPTVYMADSIVGKNWWGTISYANKPAEYYNVSFTADGSLRWEQYPGDTDGHWTLAGKKLTITFDGMDDKISADISGNNLINFSDNTQRFEILSGQKLNNPNISLANSSWSTPLAVYLDFTIIFYSALSNAVDVRNGSEYAPRSNYIRYVNSGVFRIQTSTPNTPVEVFGIVISDNEIVGSFNDKPFRLPKDH